MTSPLGRGRMLTTDSKSDPSGTVGNKKFGLSREPGIGVQVRGYLDSDGIEVCVRSSATSALGGVNSCSVDGPGISVEEVNGNDVTGVLSNEVLGPMGSCEVVASGGG